MKSQGSLNFPDDLMVRRYEPKAGERVGVMICGEDTTAIDFNC